MTERTTPITVHLTDEQMDYIEQGWGPSVWVSQAANVAVYDAVVAQRPRPLKAHDVIRHRDDNGWTLEILCLFENKAWVKHSNNKHPHGTGVSEIQQYLRDGDWVLIGNKATP